MKPQRISTPLLVLGAGLDRLVTTKEVHAAARAYRTEAEIFAGMGHDMMLEPGWSAVAERIRTWLASRGLRYSALQCRSKIPGKRTDGVRLRMPCRRKCSDP